MSGGNEPVASAVIVPEASQPPSSKRRQSPESDSVSKRGKRDNPTHDESAGLGTVCESPQVTDSRKLEDAPSDKSKDSISAVPDRRQSSIQEEKKRGKRLFGGLLSTLSQSTPNGQQKRRLEIEKRQQEKVRQQKAVDEARRAKMLANLKTIRKVEQVKYNEESMKTRHKNLRALAHFLSTKAEPKIYYKPWEMLPQDEERIKLQVADAEAIIDREQAEFYSRHPKEPRGELAGAGEANDTHKEEESEPQSEGRIEPLPVSEVADTTNSPPQASQSEQVEDEKHTLEEHNGEVVVENEEDTVIY